jgi:hypothetical protein
LVGDGGLLFSPGDGGAACEFKVRATASQIARWKQAIWKGIIVSRKRILAASWDCYHRNE